MQTKTRILTTGDNDDNEQDDDADDEAHSHLHVLPPHLLPDPVGTAPKPLCRSGQVVRLVLKAVEAFTTFRDFVDVVAHDIDSRIDFLWLYLLVYCSCKILRDELAAAGV